MEEFFESVVAAQDAAAGQYIGFLRYAIPVLGLLLLLRCALPLLTFRREPEIWGWLNTQSNQNKYQFFILENISGDTYSFKVSPNSVSNVGKALTVHRQRCGPQ